MLAMALLMLRLFPYLFSGLAWLANRSRGLVLSLGLARLARNPVRPAQVILLISLAAGLIFFTSTYTHTLVQAEEALATYRAGADLRIYPANRPLSEILALPGVKTASLVQRIPVNRDSGGTINILAVDPATFPLVTAYPPGMTGLTIPVVMGSIAWQPPESPIDQELINPYTEAVNKQNPIPAMFSQAALSQGQGLDSIVHLLFPGIRLDVKVNGILRNFPTGKGAFIIVDRTVLAQYINLDASQFTRWKEVWLSVDPGFYNLLDSLLWLKDATIADARQELAALQGNSFLQGMGHAFTLNTAIVSLLSVVGLFLVHYFTARQRTYEFGVLRAEGLSAGQLFLLLAGEALMIALIGLIAGTFLGVGLALGMHSYLNLLIGRIEEGLVLYRVQVDWLTVFRQATLLSGGYLLATLISLGLLLQAGIHRVLRIGDE
jgi:hypothetical protein